MVTTIDDEYMAKYSVMGSYQLDKGGLQAIKRLWIMTPTGIPIL